MSIVARSSSPCPECGEWIRPGDWIRKESDIRSRSDGLWRHTVCPDETPAQLVRHICPRCFEEVAVNGTCACEDG